MLLLWYIVVRAATPSENFGCVHVNDDLRWPESGTIVMDYSKIVSSSLVVFSTMQEECPSQIDHGLIKC